MKTGGPFAPTVALTHPSPPGARCLCERTHTMDPVQPTPPHALPAAELLASLGSDLLNGLSEAAVTRRLNQFGFNTLPHTPDPGLGEVFLRQFQSPLIALLAAAALISAALHHTADASVILGVLLLNAGLGTLQEGRARNALASLRKLTSLRVRILRGGNESLLEARLLVPGDILLLAAGDAVGADARLIECRGLETTEAALTGESQPVPKTTETLLPATPLCDQSNMVFAGTHVTAGRARALVTHTGSSTQIGHIAALTRNAPRHRTPLELRLAAFSRGLLWAALLFFALLLAVGSLRHIPLSELLPLAISEMVSMVPEGLPTAWTIALAVGSQRISRRGAILRTLSAVETLGSVDVICADKTGTLTCNEMTVSRILLPGERHLTVTGAGLRPEGRILEGGTPCDPENDPPLRELLEAGCLCNDARLLPPAAPADPWQALGDPTEAALLTLALKAGLHPAVLQHAWPRTCEIPFDAGKKWMLTVHSGPGHTRLLLKGAPEAVLPLCALAEPLRAYTTHEAAELAAEQLRVLAVAACTLPHAPALDPDSAADQLRGRMRLLGLIAQSDPPRPESREAVEACLRAGIRPVMITGDHAHTARAIATTLGIHRPGFHVLEGPALDALSDAELAARLDSIRVFARVHPAQKLRIVRAFQLRGHVVAMTGDGVNDAPALACADVGVAMGRTGTEVAKEASKILLTDDRFATLVQATAEGRLVHQNLRKVLLFLFATSLDEVLLLLLCLLLGLPVPLSAVQILWINVVTEGVVTVNLILEGPEGDEMNRHPHSPHEPLFTRPMRSRLALMACTSTVVCLGHFVWRLSAGAPLPEVRSEMFTLVTFCQWFNVLNCRSALRSSLHGDVLGNRWLLGGLLLAIALQAAVLEVPALARFFHTTPIAPGRLALLACAASLVLWVEEARKAAARSRDRPAPNPAPRP
jgi:magnesium-transporting ATPase (P-type)